MNLKKQNQMKIWAITFIVILNFFQKSSYADWLDENEKVKKMIQSSHNSHYPELLSRLRSVVKKMETTVNESLGGGRNKKLKDIYIYHVDGESGFASVVNKKEHDEYAIFIDTEFLKEVFSRLDDPSLTPAEKLIEIENSMHIIEGAIAHEMGHVIYQDKEYGYSNQNKEIDADIAAVALLRNAGLPRESEIKAQEFLERLSKKILKGREPHELDVVLSTHPTSDLRESAVRMNTTLDSFTTGSYVKLPRPRAEALLTELRDIPGDRSIPIDAAAAIERAENGLRDSDGLEKELMTIAERVPNFAEVKKLNPEEITKYCRYLNIGREFDWLFVRVSEALAQGRMSQDLIKRFEGLVQKRFSHERVKYLHQGELERKNEYSLCRSENMVKKVLKRDRRGAVDIIARQLPDFERWTDSRVAEIFSAGMPFQGDLSKPSKEDMINYLPSHLLAMQIVRNLYPSNFEEYESLKKGFSDFDQGVLGCKIMAELGRILSRDPESAMEELEKNSRDSKLFNFLSFKNCGPRHQNWQDLTEEDLQSIRQLAKVIWDHRERIGLIDFNWKDIFGLLGISQEQGKRDLKEAVLGNAKSSRPSKLSQSYFKWANDSSPWFKRSIGRRYSPNSEYSPDHWGGEDLLRELVRLDSESTRRQHEELMTDSVHKSIAKTWLHEWKQLGKPHAQCGEFFNDHYMKFIDEDLLDDDRDINYKLPVFIGSQYKINSNKTDRFMNLHAEYPFWRELFAQIDQESEMSDEEKRACFLSLMESYVTNPKVEMREQMDLSLSRDLQHLLPILMKYNVFGSVNKLFKWVRDFGAVRFQYMDDEELCANRDGLFTFIDPYLAPEVEQWAADLKEGKLSTQEMMRKAQAYLDAPIPGILLPEKTKSRQKKELRPRKTWSLSKKVRLSRLPHIVQCLESEHNLRRVKSILVDALLSRDETPKQVLRNFSQLVLTSPTESTDRYLRARLPQLKTDPEFLKRLPDLDLDRLVFGDSLKAELVEILIDRELEQKQIPFDRVLDKITQKLEKASTGRDRLLEKYAWRYPELDLTTLKEKVQPLKVQRIDGTDYQYFSNLMSMIGREISRANIEDRLKWIAYVKDPSPENKAIVFNQVVQWDIGGLIHDKDKNISPEQFMESIDGLIKGASPIEKVPLAEFILGQKVSGERKLYETQEFQEAMARLSGFEYGSKEGRILRAYLNACPDYEKSSVIAYFLMHQKSEGGGRRVDLKPLFEVFSTLGIKTAQLAAIFDTVDPSAKEDLSTLKDRAKELDKAEVLEILQKAMGPERAAQVKLKRILGSASIKNVVEVEWDDGRHSALMIRRPFAKQLVEEHLGRSARFIQNLRDDPELKRDRKLQEQLVSFETLGDIVKAELREEVEFEKELENTVKAGRSHGTMAKPKKVASSSWTIQVPQADAHYPGVHRVSATDEAAPAIMFMEMAQGGSIDKISDPQVRSEVGHIIVQELLTQLFSQGFMNADPHKGNFLVHPESKAIYPIDFGQAETLRRSNIFTSQDERELLAHFFSAFASQNIPRLVAYGSAFCDPEPSVETQHEIELRLKECKQSGVLDLIHVINTFQDLNARFTKRSFGILKGIAVLQKEEYVSEDEFKEILSQLIKNVLTGNWSVMARHGADQLGQQTREFVDALSRFMRIGRSLRPSGSCPR